MVVAQTTSRNDTFVEGAIRATRILSRSLARFAGIVAIVLAVFALAAPVAQAGCSAGQSQSGALRSAEAKQTRQGELSLKFYLRYESGRFWFTTAPPAPACSGPECNSDSKMNTAPALEFQVLASGCHTPKAFSSGSDFAAEIPCESQHARRGFIEVVEPPPKRA